MRFQPFEFVVKNEENTRKDYDVYSSTLWSWKLIHCIVYKWVVCLRMKAALYLDESGCEMIQEAKDYCFIDRNINNVLLILCNGQVYIRYNYLGVTNFRQIENWNVPYQMAWHHYFPEVVNLRCSFNGVITSVLLYEVHEDRFFLLGPICHSFIWPAEGTLNK